MPILEDSWNKFNTPPPENKPMPITMSNRLKL